MDSVIAWTGGSLKLSTDMVRDWDVVEPYFACAPTQTKYSFRTWPVVVAIRM